MKKEIKALFSKSPGLKLKSKEIAKKLQLLDEHSYAELKHFLFKLTEEDFLERQGKRYQLLRADSDKLLGTLQIVSSGDFGFVSLKEKNVKDIFIPGKSLSTALDGDLVEVELVEAKRGKNVEGKIVNVIERGRKEIIGVLKKNKSAFFLAADDDKIHHEIYINGDNLNGAKLGDKIAVANIIWKNKSLKPEGKVKEVLGKAGSYDAEIASIAREFNIAYKFPKSVLNEAEKISDVIPPAEIKKRTDLRSKTIITIDPEDAKDFDDAVSVDILDNGNYLVGIHIADVSYYVQPGTSLYKEALERGTSVYLVGKVIPMLPEKLSNRICSLVPNEDRLTYSVFVELTKLSKIVNYRIEKSVINSKRRFSYEEVQKIIETGSGEFSYEITLLNKISKSLRAKRMKKGSINFFSPEVVFKLDDNGVPVEIKIKEVRESHNLIEELMLLANQIVAQHVQPKQNKIDVPFVYRVHDLPDKEKITEFARFVRTLGYHFDPNAGNKSKQFQALLEEVKGSEEEAVVNEIAIRSMAKAIYSTNNIGHYGLGFRYYTHFTSPIRRFPDLAVHLIIHNFIAKGSEKNLSLEELEEICNNASAKERSAVSAERQSVKLKHLEYLKDKVGQVFHAVISGIMHFGIFVELSSTLAEGLIKLRDLEDDYYSLDEKNYCIVGRRTKKRYRLGDKVNVQLIRVDEEKREVDFVLTA
ncbi:MAG: ribonuclease R [Ignavibacteria bacterium]|nr:MAG: ribonuclease R [Ignavibacteria bacterium]KAF0160425.1 MAG: ribonuclease R [Ignavibacteria bacterium]